MWKSILYWHWSYFVQKTARKSTKYTRNETMLKIGYPAKAIAFAWAIAFAKYSIWAKILNCLKQSKSILFSHCSNSVQKTTGKNIKYSRNETMLKIGHLAKTIAFAWAKYSFAKYSICKILNLGQNFKLPRTCQNRFCNSIRVILCKKPLEKTPNIPEMRRC